MLNKSLVYFKVGNMAGPPSFDWGQNIMLWKKFLSEFVYHLDDSSFREVVPKESLHLIHLLPVPLHHQLQVHTHSTLSLGKATCKQEIGKDSREMCVIKKDNKAQKPEVESEKEESDKETRECEDVLKKVEVYNNHRGNGRECKAVT